MQTAGYARVLLSISVSRHCTSHEPMAIKGWQHLDTARAAGICRDACAPRLAAQIRLLCCRYGRRVVYMASFVAFLGSTLGCIFAPTIAVLVAFRALQGAAGVAQHGMA